ncbi:hypothetical protein CDV31_017218, partial [Fusarium ambrosium]
LQTKSFALEQSNWKLKSDSSELVAAKEVSEWQGNRGALRTTHDGSYSDLKASQMPDSRNSKESEPGLGTEKSASVET